MLKAYLDESGTHADSPVVCISGVLFEASAAVRLDKEWKKALSEAGIDYFHAVECAHLTGEFKKHDRASATKLYIHLIGLLNKYACGWASVYSLPKDKFDEFRKGKWDYGQYATCSHFCMLLLRKIAKHLHHDKISFTIEAGHENMGELRNLLKELSRLGYKKGPWQFNEKDDLRPLQAADIVAYESWKRVNEQFKEDPRPLRKSLESIISASLKGEVYFLGKSELQKLFDRKAEIIGD